MTLVDCVANDWEIEHSCMKQQNYIRISELSYIGEYHFEHSAPVLIAEFIASE